MSTTKRVNEQGIAALKAWIIETANEDHRCTDPRNMDAWCCEAEESMANGNPPVVEMRAPATISGYPETFKIPANGIYEQELED